MLRSVELNEGMTIHVELQSMEVGRGIIAVP